MNGVERLTVIGLSLSTVGMALSSQGGVNTAEGAGGLTLMFAGIVALLYAVLRSDRNSPNGH